MAYKLDYKLWSRFWDTGLFECHSPKTIIPLMSMSSNDLFVKGTSIRCAIVIWPKFHIEWSRLETNGGYLFNAIYSLEQVLEMLSEEQRLQFLFHLDLFMPDQP